MTLTEFLLARIAEDDANARAAIGKHETDEAGHWEYVEYPYEGGSPQPRGSLEGPHVGSGYDPGEAWTDLVNRFDPARILAECDAKRRIVEQCGPLASYLLDDEDGDIEGGWSEAVYLSVAAVQALALPYADHPDYDESWRP